MSGGREYMRNLSTFPSIFCKLKIALKNTKSENWGKKGKRIMVRVLKDIQMQHKRISGSGNIISN